MKRILLGLLLFTSFIVKGQVYNNEWIDYSKTYYKFKVGSDGLYRIPQSVLSGAGLGNTPAEYFQLWRNGSQVPIFTSIPAGIFSSSDYIEFWGRMNDGKPDKELYRDPTYQISDRYSLETDTAAYFLTADLVISHNIRLQNTINNVAGNVLPAEPYFMHKLGKYFKDQENFGYAANVGEYLYSSSYDKGEGWTSNDIQIGGTNTFSFPGNLSVYPGGPAPTFKIAVFGNDINTRRYIASINGDSIVGKEVDFYSFSVDSATFSLSSLASNTATVSVKNNTLCSIPTNCPTVDRMDVAMYEITYPRKFDFGGSKNFAFALPASTNGNFLQINNFSSGTGTPVLYDLTNGLKITADMTASPMLQFVLPSSSTQRDLILVSEDPSNISLIQSMQPRTFINYATAANQGNFLIITNSVLFTAPDGSNPIDDYRQYRSSPAGGMYNAKIYVEDQITDQFGFGIKKNPAAVRDFIRFAKNRYGSPPKFVFIIGKGLNYFHQNYFESWAHVDELNLVTTFGYPASDNLFTAEPGSSLPLIPIGRLSVINGSEVAIYLKKVKAFELAQATLSPYIADRGWMKNVVHITGTSNASLQATLDSYMSNYKQIISDTLFGGNVNSFSKASANEVEQINSSLLQNLFSTGISLITYFGHSSSTTLEFNIDEPQNYNNFGKYPMFIALGCNVGNFFNYNVSRLITDETLSEKYVLSPDKGTIGMLASTNFSIVQYCDIWASRAYQEITNRNYGRSIGEILTATAADVFNYTSQEDFYARCNIEQTEWHGDPSLRVNPHPKPDYVIEDPMVKISPAFISIGNHSFKVDAKMMNIGKAINKPIVVQVKRQFPDMSVKVILRDTIPGIRYLDSLSFNVPIDPLHDKGLNRITIMVDADSAVDEMYETNNTITKDVMIYEDAATPVYPYNYAIINHQNIKLEASTANPFAATKLYRMEMDTTWLFNSPIKIAKTTTSSGGLIEFDPGITFMDSTVYYWRVAPDTSSSIYNWNTASFIYIQGTDAGFNQSHYFQHLESTNKNITLKGSRVWTYDSVLNSLFIQNAVYGTASTQIGNFTVSVNGDNYIRSACVGFSLIFNVFDQHSFKPWNNATGNKYGSGLFCGAGREWNFEYSYMDPASRKLAMDFMDTIPVGAFVVVRNIMNNTQTNNFAKDWMADTTLYGHNNSLYHKLKAAGLAPLDSFDSPKGFALIYQKGVNGFTPVYNITQGMYDIMTMSAKTQTPDSTGTTTSPLLGPAKTWKKLIWAGTSSESPSADRATVDIIGIKQDGSADTLMTALDINHQNVDLSGINAILYPYLQLHLNNTDDSTFTPYQLKYWRITYVPVPEGAVAPNLYLQMKDTLEVAEPLEFRMAFKNISEVAFDSLKFKAILTDKNNVQHILAVPKLRPLASTDTVIVHFPIDTKQYTGSNRIYIEVNPDNDQPEQYHFNNSAIRSFFVKGDTLNPLLDVTFDNVHILNDDIVSAKPEIVILLKDEAKYNLLNDPSVLKLKVQYPDGIIHSFNFNSDTLQFIPAQTGGKSNSASAIFKPYFLQDGKYTLIVTGQDMSQNQAGNMQYKVSFEVINKPMISNMMNYPNPFTTHTAFVFTLTGSDVPQNIKIQILTITGKIVREITKEQLGPIHIGRNITEFKWDGTDQYGDKLANGIYLYHVVTNLNGKSLDKYKSDSDNTDKYFKKGYGKMYLMR